MIVPLIFDVLTYKKDDPVYSWVFYRFIDFVKNGNGFVIANENYYSFVDQKCKKYFAANCRDMEYTFPKNSEIQASQKYQISNLEMEHLVSKYETPYQMIKHMVVERDEDFENLLSSRLDAIEADSHQKIDAIFLWVGLKSVYEVAQKRNIKVIVLELSSIRKPNYNTTLGYFSFQDKYDRRGCKDDYYEFMKAYNKKPFPLLSRKELLSFFVATDELSCLESISGPEPYELGISPGLQQDYFFENFANEPLQDTLKKIKILFDDNRVSVRFHPRYQWKLPYKKWSIDQSKSSFDWILKCRRIVTSVSNVGFEAMLLGKTAYVLSDYMPYSFMAPNHLNYIEDEIVSIQFLNYMLFSYFVPWRLMFDMDYIRWRLTDPSPVERFHRHYEYLCREKGVKGKVTLEKILRTVHHLSDDQIEYFKNLNSYQRNCEKEEQIRKLTLENQTLENELLNIQNSKSWKITMPLRKIVFGISKFKNICYSRLHTKLLHHLNKKIAIQIHVFYPDLLEEIYDNLKQMPYAYDLYISTDTDFKKKIIQKFFNEKNITQRIVIEVFENKGRDIYPFLQQLKGRIKEYDYILHLHTKKSKHCLFGDSWRHYLYYNLLGSKKNIMSIFYKFEKNKKIGLVFPETYPAVKDMMLIGGSGIKLQMLCDRLNITTSFNNIFPAGSMFWAKVDSILPLFDHFSKNDFDIEKDQLDGTFAHAVERVFVMLCESRGYDYLQMNNNFEER